MEIHDPNLHLKLIEMCDCYLETDFKAQIQKTAKAAISDLDEDSCKYLALTIMYAITEKAQKLTYKSKKGQWTVTIRADGDKTSVKAPSPEVFKRIISIIRTILHLEDDNASMVLSLGLRGGQVDIQVKVERGESKEALRFKFPDLG
jgi:type II secretory ATPase GspE/PulE/Tfp pilus assembly ATPase PilB-like protein